MHMVVGIKLPSFFDDGGAQGSILAMNFNAQEMARWSPKSKEDEESLKLSLYILQRKLKKELAYFNDNALLPMVELIRGKRELKGSLSKISRS